MFFLFDGKEVAHFGSYSQWFSNVAKTLHKRNTTDNVCLCIDYDRSKRKLNLNEIILTNNKSKIKTLLTYCNKSKFIQVKHYEKNIDIDLNIITPKYEMLSINSFKYEWDYFSDNNLDELLTNLELNLMIKNDKYNNLYKKQIVYQDMRQGWEIIGGIIVDIQHNNKNTIVFLDNNSVYSIDELKLPELLKVQRYLLIDKLGNFHTCSQEDFYVFYRRG